ncbi:nickel pincer cofactor biosynthesis protein LarC [Desulfatitalea alkaliphila]|uniref:Putative nickel insertion protein n=1 Tax=Desulfatitalea alkaliphila TaxID=2929485 RepID=A0AA41R8P8_9BACT|nr:nickel pincer cofactor biosynthesis protein LarC [Desulfatitalea alkaliphila]MCJ8503051.1 nickel pincer cofactor biosynthesis protein LarC [Desulfatitalea alkaliphila]
MAQGNSEARLAYLDCFSGISGDMTLGALVHLGVPVGWLEEQLRGLPLADFALAAESVSRSGIKAMQVQVRITETHHHRGLADIESLIGGSDLSDGVKSRSLAVFHRLAEAEAAVHGCDKSTVHFHEVGAVDAIVDIVGTCLGLEYLGIQRLVVSPLPMGCGFVKCAHGVLPVPAPATLELLKGVPIYGDDAQMELVTPTGAAIATGLAEGFQTMPPMRMAAVGYGAGSRQTEGRPNLLRVVTGTPLTVAEQDRVASRWEDAEPMVVVETCIDDMNPEIFGYLMERLFAEGALDVFWVPVQMKKNRPGTWVQVLCRPERRGAIVERLLSETTTLGVRFHEVQRTALARETVAVDSVFGKVMVKQVRGLEGTVRHVPEYEACRRIALEKGLPLRQVYEAVARTAKGDA